MCFITRAMGVAAVNGGSPDIISNRITPREYRSLRASIPLPIACSGERYRGVPQMKPVCVRDSCSSPSVDFAMPKSRTLMKSLSP